MIFFNKPIYLKEIEGFVNDSMKGNSLAGDGEYCKKCQSWFEKKLGTDNVFLMPSCTHALEAAALLCDINPSDEVIMPSYTFVSTANAFVLRGAKIVFVDICPDSMNIDPLMIEQAITKKTKVIVPVHYAGVGCDMDAIMDIARKNNLIVVEDAAQGMMSSYKNRPLGSIGHLGAYSFHETKNYTSGGEGGLLIVNDSKFVKRAEVIREKGTNRKQFFRGMVDKYSWVDIGSSYLMNEISAAHLWGQLINADKINNKRISSWNIYHDLLEPLEGKGLIVRPKVDMHCEHNAHMYYIKVKDLETRNRLISFLKKNEIMSVFHYVPLHSAKAGIKYGIFHSDDKYTTSESERLVRLPMYYELDVSDIKRVALEINNFFKC